MCHPPLLSLTRRTHTNACATREVERLAPLRGMYGAGARRWMDMEGRRGGIKATLQVRMRLTVGERRGKEVIGVDG